MENNKYENIIAEYNGMFDNDQKWLKKWKKVNLYD